MESAKRYLVQIGAPQTQQQGCLFWGLMHECLAAVFPKEAGPVPPEQQMILGQEAGPSFSPITWHLQSPPPRYCLTKALLDQQLLVGSPGWSGSPGGIQLCRHDNRRWR